MLGIFIHFGNFTVLTLSIYYFKGGRGRACINFEIARCKNNHFSLQNMDIIYIRGIRQWRRGAMALAVLSPEGGGEGGGKMSLNIHILKCS